MCSRAGTARRMGDRTVRDWATVEVLRDTASDTCLGVLWLSPGHVLIVAAGGFAELCLLMEARLGAVLDEIDRHHEDWPSTRGLLRFRRIPLRYLEIDRTAGKG